MIGLIAPKKSYYHTAKWRSNEDRNETDNFKFKIRKNHDIYKTDLGNMKGSEGTFEIETKSGIKFKVEDFVYWKGMRFNITKTDINMSEEEQAYNKFNFNGNITTVLSLRKAGNE